MKKEDNIFLILYIFILIIALFFVLKYVYNKDKFTTIYTLPNCSNNLLNNCHIINSAGNEAKRVFRNFSLLNGKTLPLHNYNNVRQNSYFDSFPTLTFKSSEDCPVLFNLFRGLRDYDDANSNLLQSENLEGMKFRKRIQSVFYNIDTSVLVDYRLLHIKVDKDDNNVDTPNFVFTQKVTNSPADNSNDISLSYKTESQNHLNYDMKHSVFNVRENFEIGDIMNFMDYCFTHLTWGAVNINLMSITDNHFYALQSPIKHSNNKYFFFLVPVRIVMLCLEEGKEYTRAKCNGSSLNIVVYFNEKPPEKFKKIFDRNLEATTTTVGTRNEIFDNGNGNSLSKTNNPQISNLILNQ